MLMDPENKAAAPTEKQEPKKQAKKPLITDVRRKGRFFSIRRIFDDKDKKIILPVMGTGIALNFALFCIFNTEFNWYSWIGWGLAMWIIEKRVPAFIRGAFR